MKTKIYIFLLVLWFFSAALEVSAAWYGGWWFNQGLGYCSTDGQADTIDPTPVPGWLYPGTDGVERHYSQTRVTWLSGPWMYCEYWDATDPSISANNASTSWRKVNVTITLSSSDWGWSGLSYAKYIWDVNNCFAAWTPYNNGNTTSIPGQWQRTLYLCAEDGIGNSSTWASSDYKLDSVIPSVSADSVIAGWTNSNSNITLSVSDTAPSSGISYTRYKWNDSTCTTGTNFVNGTTITRPGQWINTLYLCAADNAGNTDTWNGTYRFDSVIPSVSANMVILWQYSTNPTITLSVSDPAPSSGIAYAKYRWDNPVCTAWTNYVNNDAISMPSPWIHTLYLCVADNAGNTDTWNADYRWDNTPPTVYASNTGTTWKNADIPLTLYAIDAESGINTAKYIWKYNGAAAPSLATCLASGTPYSDGATQTVTIQWDHDLYLCATDNAGNQSILWWGTYRLDKKVPTVSASNASATWKKVDITIVLSANDPPSSVWTIVSDTNIRKYIWKYNGAAAPSLAACLAWGTPFIDNQTITGSVEWDNDLYLCANDNATNQSLLWSGSYRLDKTRPTASATNANTTWKNANITVTLTTDDPIPVVWTIVSGTNIRKYYLDIDNAFWVPSPAICLASWVAYTTGDSFTISIEGDHTLYLCTEDLATNQSLIWSGVYRLDKTRPTVSADNASLVWKNIPISIILSAIDPLPAPGKAVSQTAVRKYLWDYNSATSPSLADCLGAAGTAYVDPTTIVLSTDWNQTLYLCATDNATNQSYSWSGVYRLDQIPPTGTIDYFDGWTNAFNTQTVLISVNDPLPGPGIAISDVQNYTVQVSTSTDSPTFATWTPFSDVAGCVNMTSGNCALGILNTHTAYKYQLIVRDIAGNISAIINSPKVLKIDTTIPTLADVTNLNPPNYLAGTHIYGIDVNNNSGSPIVTIEWNSENKNLLALPDFQSSITSTLLFNWDKSDVDSDRTPSGGRDYTFRLTRFCDQVWNCWNGINTSVHTVYANTKSITQHHVISEDLSASWNIADWSTKNLTLELKDIYGNIIIPAPGIGRNIDFNFDVNNTMYLDQFSRSGGDAVFLDRTTNSGVFINRLTNSGSFNAEISTDGKYSYRFQVYTPTFNQNFWPISDPLAEFTINTITYDINSSTLVELWDTPQAIPIIGTPVISKFSPLFSTAIVGDLRNWGFIEWTEQVSGVNISKHSVLVNPPGTLDITFSWSNANAFRFYANTISPPGTEIIASGSLYSSTFPSATLLYSQLVQRPWFMVSNLSSLYTSTHLKYVLNGYSITTNSDLVGRSSYYNIPTSSAWNQVGIKILGSIWGNNINAIVTDQFSTGASVFTNTDRSLIREQIKKNIFLATRNATLLPISSSLVDITNLPWVWAMASGTIIRQSSDRSIMLIEKVWWNVELTASMISWVRTLVIRWANLYIKNDMYYDPSKPSILGVIIQKDENNNGWNLYIDPGVTNVVGTYVIDRSVMSYDGASELWYSTSIAVLKNQLYIFGTILSDNTIGWSRQNPPKCPNLLSNPCSAVPTLQEAQKYDLNYLRRYYLVDGGVLWLNPFGTGKIIGSETCTAGVCTNINTNLIQKFMNTNEEFAKYPTIIEFNPAIQSLIPIGFDLVFE